MSRSPRTLVDARLQLHWASQVVSAAADALLERAEDDGQSAMTWEQASGCLVGRDLRGEGALRLELANPGLIWGDTELVLSGQTLEAALIWAHRVVPGLSAAHRAMLRGYDMPDHPFAQGVPFDGTDTEAFAELARWAGLGWTALEEACAGEPASSRLRWWPHHFDAGSIIDLGDEQRSIGIGFSLGDEGFEEPYFYVNPYGLPERHDTPPSLSIGHWEQGSFRGYAAPASVLAKDPLNEAMGFLEEAIPAARAMLEAGR